jgi:hypothetical protein
MLCCAETFGWTPETVRDLDWYDVQMLIEEWNDKQRKINFQSHVARSKNKRW